MKKCSFSAWPRGNEGKNQWMKLQFVHEETSRNCQASQAKGSHQDGGSGIGRWSPFSFLGHMVTFLLFFFFFGVAAVKTFRGAVSLQSFFFFKNDSPWNLGKWSNEKLAHIIFFQWVAQTTGSPTNQLNPHGVSTGFPEGRRAAHAFREQQRGAICATSCG